MKNYLIILCIFLPCWGFAQKDSDTARKFSIQLSAIPAFSQLDFKSLNTSLSSNGLPTAKNGFQLTPAFSIISKPFSYNKIIMVLIAGMNNNKSSANGHVLEQTVIFGELGVGKYVFEKNRKSGFLGLGFGSMQQNINVNNNIDAGSFSAALQQYKGSVSIRSRNNNYIALNTGFDWAIDNKEDLLIGLRLVYRIGLGRARWEIKDRTYADSPETSVNGFFLGLALSMR